MAQKVVSNDQKPKYVSESTYLATKILLAGKRRLPPSAASCAIARSAGGVASDGQCRTMVTDGDTMGGNHHGMAYDPIRHRTIICVGSLGITEPERLQGVREFPEYTCAIRDPWTNLKR